MDKPKTEQAVRFPIRELSARTQVNTVTLRAWERRYGLLVPKRTEKGHRLYSEEDVHTVNTILALAARGVPLSKVKGLLASTPESVEETNPVSMPEDVWCDAIDGLKSAAESFAINRMEHAFAELFLNYPAELVGKQVIEPVFNGLAESVEKEALSRCLESELIRYMYLKISQKTASSGGRELYLVGGEQASFWRLALAALVLWDAQYRVRFICARLSVSHYQSMLQTLGDSLSLYYQDGRWKANEVDQVRQMYAEYDHALFCGTAPMLAMGSDDHDRKRIFADVSRCTEFLMAL